MYQSIQNTSKQKNKKRMLKRRTTGFEPVNNGTTTRCRNPLATPAYNKVKVYLILRNYEEYVRLFVILIDI
jgi:hypothetical protein